MMRSAAATGGSAVFSILPLGIEERALRIELIPLIGVEQMGSGVAQITLGLLLGQA